MQDDPSKALLEHALGQLSHGRFAPFSDLLADDVTWTITGTTPWSRTDTGKPAVLTMLAALAARIDGSYRMTPHRFIADGALVVVEGQGNNQLKTGQRYDNTYCWVCRFDHGRLRDLVEYMDTALALRVLGDVRAS